MSPDDIEALLQGHSDSLAEWAKSVRESESVPGTTEESESVPVTQSVESVPATPKRRPASRRKSGAECEQ